MIGSWSFWRLPSSSSKIVTRNSCFILNCPEPLLTLPVIVFRKISNDRGKRERKIRQAKRAHEKNQKKEEHRRRGPEDFLQREREGGWLGCARKRATFAQQSALARATYKKIESFQSSAAGALCVCRVFLSCLFYFSLSHTHTHTNTQSKLYSLITPPPNQLARPTPLLAFVRQPPLLLLPGPPGLDISTPLHHLPSQL